MSRSGQGAGAWGRSAALAAGSFALLLALLEIGARLLFEQPQTIAVEDLDYPVGSDASIALGGATARPLLVSTPTGTRLWRNSRVVIRNHSLSHLDLEITTNSRGYRYAELGPRTGREFRVLALGDSIIFGGYLPAELTIPARVESLLEQTAPPPLRGRDVQVVNAGIGGIDLQTEFAILMETGLAIEPDVVLVGLYLNDGRESLYLRVAQLPRPLHHSRLLSLLFDRIDVLRAAALLERAEAGAGDSFEREREQFARAHAIADEPWRESDAGFNLRIHAAFYDWGYAWSEGFWRKLEPVLRLMRAASEEHGFRLAVVLFPVRLQVQAQSLRDEPQRRFAALMGELGIPHLDLLPALRARYQRDGRDLFYDYCHYRPRGTAFVGREIARFLVDEVVRGRPLQ